MNLDNITKPVKEYLQQLTAKKKKQIVIAIGLCAILTIISMFFILHKDYEIVFTRLSPQDSGLITEQLDAEDIEYKLMDDGTSIAVVKEQADKARISVARANVNFSGSVGYEILDNLKLSATDKERDVQIQRALQGEIERTLRAYPGVVSVRVHLSVPQKSPFVKQDDVIEPEASVVLTLETGSSITEDSANGIANVVASAVKGLSPANVDVMDQNFVQLNSGGSGIGSTGSTVEEQMEVENTFEADLERNIVKALAPIFGYENLKINVSATLNFNHIQRDKRLFEPIDKEKGEGIARKIVELEEFYEGTNGSGIPGVDSNDPNSDTYGMADSSNSEEQRKQRTIEYEINETVESLVVAPGTVQSLSVSVILNQEEMSEEQEAALKNTVAAIVGKEHVTEDYIVINAMEFNIPEVEVPEVQEPSLIDKAMSPFIIGPVLSIIIGLIGFMILKNNKQPDYTEIAQQYDPAKEIELKDREPSEHQKIIQQLKKEANRKPDDFALLVKTWLREE